tara:strand:+ start:20025 stop:21311 length:1287 start_codon:yes stop_codon:yes gene_type:complete
MIIFSLIILFFNSLLAQSSSLSLYGIGERIYSYDANSVSIGNSRLFTSNSNDFSISSQSTYYNNSQANLSMSMSFSKMQSDSIDELLSNNFHHLSFGFPLTDNQYFMLSMNPRFRSNIVLNGDFEFIGANQSNIDYDEDGEYDPLQYRNDYEMSGGISEISSSISSKLNDNISLGFKIGQLFGTNSMEHVSYFHVIDFDAEGNLINQDANYPPVVYRTFNKYNYSSLTYKIDMRFNLRNDNVLAFYFGQSDHLDVSLDSFTKSVEQNGSIVLDYDYTKDYIFKGYMDYGIGFKSHIYENFGYILELQKYDAFHSLESINILNNSDLDMDSYHAGLFFRYDDISASGINAVNLNLGLYGRSFKAADESVGNDLAITFGIGLDYLNNNSFMLSFESGKRNSEYDEFKDEKYHKLIFSFVSNTMWFIKEGD